MNQKVQKRYCRFSKIWSGRRKASILVHVQQLEGKSLMIDMLGEAEMSTLRESLKGSEHKEALDRQSEKILNFYRKSWKTAAWSA